MLSLHLFLNLALSQLVSMERAFLLNVVLVLLQLVKILENVLSGFSSLSQFFHFYFFRSFLFLILFFSCPQYIFTKSKDEAQMWTFFVISWISIITVIICAIPQLLHDQYRGSFLLNICLSLFFLLCALFFFFSKLFFSNSFI